MARINGVDLPREKRVEIGLTYIYGIGRKSANDILGKTGINPDTRAKDLTEEDVAKLRDIIETSEDTQYEVAFNDEMKKLSTLKHMEREAAAKERARNRAPTVEENIATLVKQNAELLAKLNK